MPQLTDEEYAALGLPTPKDVIKQDLDYLFQTTSKATVEAFNDMMVEGKTVQDFKQALQDMGTFSPNRALTAARTLAGTAASVGQIGSAASQGATHKTWHDSGFHVRDQHIKRNGETVLITERFSAQFGDLGPMYPGDPDVAAADRINCRCSMTFERRDGVEPPVQPKPTVVKKTRKPSKKAALAAAKTAAADYVLKSTKTMASQEFAYVYDGAGNKLFSKPGVAHSVNFTNAEIQSMVEAKDVVLVHNHPSGLSLSDADIGFAERIDGTVVAIGETNGVEYAVNKVKLNDSYGADYKKVESFVDAMIMPEISAGSLTSTEANLVYYHAINSALSKKGYFNYTVNGLNLTGMPKTIFESIMSIY